MELITGNDPNLEYVDMLGSGGYGSVYKVTQCLALTELQLKVVHNGKVIPRIRCRMLITKLFARKIIRVSDQVKKEDIENEAMALGILRIQKNRVNIIKIFQHKWIRDGEAYVIDMELGKGTLHDYIKESRKVDGNYRLDIWNVMQQVTAGVADLHKHGIIHRDLKPANSITLLSFS